MTLEQERFAELATRSLEASPDLREDARAEVLGRLAHGGSEEIDDATDRLESMIPRSSRRWAWVIALVILTLSGIAAWQVRQVIVELGSLQAMTMLNVKLKHRDSLRESLDAETRDFVFAHSGTDSETIRNLERQWELHPELPGIYEELIHQRLAAKQGLPADFPATWRRIDPDNGMWLYLEAMGRQEEWKKSGPPAGETFSAEVIDLLRQSAAAPHFESRIPALRARRVEMLPQSGTLAEECRMLEYMIVAFWVPTMREQQDTLDSFTKATAKAVAEKDREGLVELIASWKRLVGRLGAESRSLLEQITIASSWKQTGLAMLEASRDLGLKDEETRLDGVLKKFADYQANYTRRIRDPKPMSFLAMLMSVGSSAEIDPALYEPGRRVEYAVMERVLSLTAALVVLIFLIASGIESLRRGRRLNGLADGLRPLFRPVDALWIAALGVVLPAVFYLGIMRWTPFGLRDIGMTAYSPRPIFIQTGATLIFALLMIIRVTRWRIGKRAGLLALKPARPWIGWTMTFVAAAVILVAGGVRWLSGNETRYLQSVAATGGLSLLWLMWEAGSVAFASRDHALGGVLLCRRMMVPLALLAVLLLASWVPLSATERHWLARDQVSRADRANGGMTFMEGRVVNRLRGYFLEAFPEKAIEP